MIQSYDGENAWWINPFMGSTEAQPMPPEMAEDFTSEVFEDRLLNYAEKGHKVELLGQTEVDGAMCYEIKLTRDTGEEDFTYFDTENFVPIMQKMIMKSGPAAGQAVETYLSNYEEVGDFVMPMYMESRAGGAVQMTITINKAEFNPEIEDNMFSAPEK
jgi:outer membrane lipoprotein-sorting protein